MIQIHVPQDTGLNHPGKRLSRRTLLFSLAGAPLAASVARAASPEAGTTPSARAYELPPLPYPYSALQPHIDERTMRLHHDRHHATYVTRLSEALAKHPELRNKKPHDLLRDLESVPEEIRTAVRNHGGGHVNHTMFWQIMKPRGGGEPTGPIATAITSAFGSFDTFKQRFNEAGERQFGSGWVWLTRTRDGKLQITTTPNQDSPWMTGDFPVMGNDVWEHAYYLKYQNRRADYLKAWWNVVNWGEVNQRLRQADP